MTWRVLPPLSIVRERRVRRAAARLLAELGAQRTDARPVAVPRTRVSIMWLVAFAAVIFVLVRAGESALRRSGVLDDFIVPGDFRGAGFYLFRSEQHFGIGARGDRVALFPRADPYELVRLMGTNGWNYGTGPDSIVAWLALLGRDEPFGLIGIGFDWIEGRFFGEPRDAHALARRFYAFCPDIVDQATGTVAALASELRRARTLYCWWD